LALQAMVRDVRWRNSIKKDSSSITWVHIARFSMKKESTLRPESNWQKKAKRWRESLTRWSRGESQWTTVSFLWSISKWKGSHNFIEKSIGFNLWFTTTCSFVCSTFCVTEEQT
jgi:hypothetical protein